MQTSGETAFTSNGGYPNSRAHEETRRRADEFLAIRTSYP
jgi:hypothetical protein